MYRIILTDYMGESTFCTEQNFNEAEQRAKELSTGSYDWRGIPYSVGVSITDEDYNLIKLVQRPKKSLAHVLDYGRRIIRF